MKLMMKSLETSSAVRDKTETIKEDTTFKGRPKTYRKRKLSMTCNLCGKNYTSRMLMKHHMRRYHVVNVLQCNICDKQLTGKKRLEDHMRTHNPQVECNGCNKWFQEKSFKKHQLKCGVRYKKKDNKHMCMFCDLRFSDKRKLRAHSKIHIKCQECDKFCRNEQTFERHRKRMHATKYIVSYECDKCQYKTNRKQHMKQHLVVHTQTPDPELLCNVCGHQFKTHSNLKRHKEKVCNLSELHRKTESLVMII